MTTAAPDTSTPAGILRLGNAFCDAQALLTATELDLFSTLHGAPATEEQIRERLGLHGRGLRDLLTLLTALGLLERAADDTYGNAAGADRYLVRGSENYIGGFLLRAKRNLYPAWGLLGEALRSGSKQSAGDFAEVTRRPELLRQFIGMMDALTQQLAPELSKAIDWSAYASMLDVGGCRGNLAGHLVKAHPHLTGHVFDLPAMHPHFDEHIAGMGLTGAVTFHGGDFFQDPLPSADVVILGHVLHDWDERQRAELIGKAYAAVNPGGLLLVYDRMLGDDAGLIENLVISLDMLLVTDGGSEYPAEEIHEHARAAGFATTSQQSLSDYDTLVICRKE